MQSVKIAGKAHPLGKRIGKGGEGEVYTLEGQPGRAVKLYNENLRQKREPKVLAMVASDLAATTDLVAYPAEIVTDVRSCFAGFVMRLLSGYRPIHELYSPKSRKRHFPKADYRFLIRAALNVSRAVAKVHQTSCVIGDFNHSGVLVSPEATVALIDADSFQFTRDGRSYPCVVGVPDFTPPELHGVNLSTTTRTHAHDHFGLAVAIFQLLAMGKHPYAGRFDGGDLTLSDAIAQNRFAFSIIRKAQTRTAPPPGSVDLSDFPGPVAQAFEAAFGLDPAARPDAGQWVAVLKDLEASLSHCSTIRTHYFPSAAGKCVWCRVTARSGIEFFPDSIVTPPPGPLGPFDIEQIWARIRAIALPRPEDLIPKWTGSLNVGSLALAHAERSRKLGRSLGIAVLISAVAGFAVMPAAVILWIVIGFFGLFKLFGSSIDKPPFTKAYEQASRQVRESELAFLQRIGFNELKGIHEDLERWVTEYRQLDPALAAAIRQLQATREARQRDAFLDRFRIREAKISGIGPAKTATLASYGIETAADIVERAVLAVPGFGTATTARLLAWRQEKEVRFRYNPTPDAADIQTENAARAADAAKRTDLQSKILSAVAALETGPQRLVARGQIGDPLLAKAQEARARAARDLELLGLPIPPETPIIPVPRTFPPIVTPPSISTRPSGGSTSPGIPSCPHCGAPMRLRTARRGGRAGHQFWGCSRYPSCKGIRN